MIVSGTTILLLSVMFTYLGVVLFRRRSLKKNWLDFPNDRSSHKHPIPRGAGLIIVIVTLTTYCLISFAYPKWFSWSYLAGALAVAGISWLDDLKSVSFAWRLLIHFVSASLVVYVSGYWRSVGLSVGNGLELGVFGPIVTILWIVWVINSYNFMDGIDGLAGVQALVTAGAWSVVAGFSGQSPTMLFSIALAGSAMGFLFLNWSPAKVFMGDVGSAFLGYTLASVPLLFVNENVDASVVPVIALLFLWPFMFDSIFTLFRRIARGERIWTAHRGHLYQRLVIAGYTHSSVSKLYGVFAIASFVVGLNVLLFPGVYTNLLILMLVAVSLIFAALIFWRLGDSSARVNVE